MKIYYKNNRLISLIFRPLETIEEDEYTEFTQINKRSRLQQEQKNKAILRVIMYNYKT